MVVRARFVLPTVLALCGLGACTQDEPASRPNILYIVADDLGFTDIQPFGSEIATPTLNELALAGVRLTNFHTDSNCQRTRVMLMSGAGSGSALEVIGNPMSGLRGNLLRREWAILPELLQDAGYATYMTGKWDLGIGEGYTPATRGFDRSFALLDASASHFKELLWENPIPYEDEGVPMRVEDLPDDFYATRFYTDRMLEYLRGHEGDRPWFAFVPYTTPHWPLQLPDDWLDRNAGRYDAGYDALREDRFARASELGVIPPGGRLASFRPVAPAWSSLSEDQRRRTSRAQEIYAGMVEYLDMSVGRLIAYLEESGQLDNTVIVFSSDHGGSSDGSGLVAGDDSPRGLPGRNNALENFGRPGSFIDHGRGFAEAATAPFSDVKGAIGEGGLRAAAFVHYPAAIEGGRVSHEFMTIMDVLPTFLEIAASAHPGATSYKGREIHAIDGRSFWPYLTGASDRVHEPTDSAGWTAGGGHGALIRGNYKLINERLRYGGVTPWRLYDIAADPGETRDLAMLFPGLTAEMAAEWERDWR
ncbi:MAG TPA: sulfatase-like hydrolase/transferase [Gammaproteobacteria bacterium]